VIRAEVSAQVVCWQQGQKLASGCGIGLPNLAGFRIFQIIMHVSVQTDWSVGVAIGDAAAYNFSQTELWYTSGHVREHKNTCTVVCHLHRYRQGNVKHKSDAYVDEFVAHLHIEYIQCNTYVCTYMYTDA